MVTGDELRALAGSAVDYQPTTFVERGVGMPFTGPDLSGSRARPADQRPGREHPLELLVPNLAGGPGFYVLPWPAIHQVCHPTLHDRALIQRMNDPSSLTPSAVRRLGLDIAAGGLAGLEAAAAAAAATERDRLVQALNHDELVALLLTQLGRVPISGGPDLAGRTRRALHDAAAGLQRTPEELEAALAAIAGLFIGIGIGRGAGNARVPAALARLASLHESLTAWMQSAASGNNPDGGLILQAITLTLRCAQSAFSGATGLLNDLPALIARWEQEPAALGALIERVEWLLDGWERIGLIWQTSNAGRDRTLAEMADLVPAIPREVSDWVGCRIENAAGITRSRRRVSAAEDWRTGELVHELIARNETLQVAALRPQRMIAA